MSTDCFSRGERKKEEKRKEKKVYSSSLDIDPITDVERIPS